MPKTFQFANLHHPVFGDEPRTDAFEIQGQPLDEFLMKISALLK